MSVLKWILIIFGVLLVIVVAISIGGYFWAQNIEPVKLTVADVEVGGAYPAEERQALLDSCEKSLSSPDAKADGCKCIADQAATKTSRYERLAITALLEGSPKKFVAVTKGLINSGIPEDVVKEKEGAAEERINDLMKACGLEK